jgi:hypothetical protein
MTANRKRIAAFTVALVALIMMASLAAASPSSPGTPTLRWVATGNPNVSEIRADGITNGGIQGNGAMNWDIYFRFPGSVSAPYPSISIQAGPQFLAQAPCTFATNVSPLQPSAPGPSGDRGVLINGFCTTGVPDNPVVGDNVLVATVTFSGCPAQGFIMDLDSGDDVYGAQVAAMVDRTNDAYYFTDADLTDGPACGGPTAVELVNVQAETAPAANYGLLLALAVLILIVAGAALVLRRRNVANS